MGAVAAAVLLNQIQPLQGYIQPGFLKILQDHELLIHSIAADLLQSPVASDTVVDVHHVVSRSQLSEVRNKDPASGPGWGRMGEELHFVENILVPKDADLGGVVAKPFQDVAHHDPNPGMHPIGLPVLGVEVGNDRKIVFPKHFPKALGSPRGRLGEQQSNAGFHPLAQVLGQACDVPVILSDGRRLAVDGDSGRSSRGLRP